MAIRIRTCLEPFSRLSAHTVVARSNWAFLSPAVLEPMNTSRVFLIWLVEKHFTIFCLSTPMICSPRRKGGSFYGVVAEEPMGLRNPIYLIGWFLLQNRISPRFSPSKPWVASLRNLLFSFVFSNALFSLISFSTASKSALPNPSGGSSSLSRSISPSSSTFSPRTKKMPCDLSAYKPLGWGSWGSDVVMNMRSIVD